MTTRILANTETVVIHPHLVLAKIERLLGLRYLPHQWSDLLRLLKPAAKELKFESVDACLLWLQQGTQREADISCLAKHLTIGESYFFREVAIFSILRDVVIPQILRRKSETGDGVFRAWSAGCSTGEEVYTIAIIIASMLREDSGMRVEILGTDVNPIAVERAEKGVYRDWSFRDMPSDLVDTWFSADDENRYSVNDRLRSIVSFRLLNLVDTSSYPTNMDIILCRNVLMYFTRPAVQEMVLGFRRALRPDGWLIPSQTETTLINQPGLEGIRFGEQTLFRHQAPSVLPFSSASRRDEEQSDDILPAAPIRSLRSTFDGILPSDLFDRNARTEGIAGPEQTMEDMLPAYAPQVEDVSSFDELLHANISAEVPHIAAPESEPVRTVTTSALALADAGRLEEARVEAERAVAADKMNAFNHFILGTVLRELGETNLAMQSFERAIYLEPDNVAAHFGLGSLYRFLGRREKSVRHFRCALDRLDAIPNQDDVLVWSDMTAKHLATIIRTIEAGEA